MSAYAKMLRCVHVNRATGAACGHTWIARTPDRPARCPKCGSVRWDKPQRKEG